MRTRTYPVSITRWFPSDDPIAIAVAKLCILREDYFLELQGLVIPGPEHLEGELSGKGIPGLDDNSVTWRRLYFFRNSMRTLNEIRNLAHRMAANKRDKDALEKEPTPLIDGFKKLRDQLGNAEELVRDLRDSIGGHVLHQDIGNILKELTPDLHGFFQDGEIRGKIRYKFSTELVLSMMLNKVDAHHEEEKMETLFGSTAKLVFILTTIDEIIRAYIVDRKLLAT